MFSPQFPKIIQIMIAALSITVSGCVSTKMYPACNVKCLPEEEREQSCQLLESDFLDASKVGNAESIFEDTKVVHVDGNLIVIAATNGGHAALEKNWQSFACPAPLAPVSHAAGRNYALCLSNAQRWLDIMRTQPMGNLVSDKAFRQVCLNSTN